MVGLHCMMAASLAIENLGVSLLRLSTSHQHLMRLLFPKVAAVAIIAVSCWRLRSQKEHGRTVHVGQLRRHQLPSPGHMQGDGFAPPTHLLPGCLFVHPRDQLAGPGRLTLSCWRSRSPNPGCGSLRFLSSESQSGGVSIVFRPSSVSAFALLTRCSQTLHTMPRPAMGFSPPVCSNLHYRKLQSRHHVRLWITQAAHS